MAKGIRFGHVEWIIGSNKHVIYTECLDQPSKLMGREHDTVDENILKIMRRWFRQVGAAVRASPQAWSIRPE